MNKNDNVKKNDTEKVLVDIADYVWSVREWGDETLNTAALCLTDSVACAVASLSDPDCVRLLGPLFPEYTHDDGVQVLGTNYILDPVKAAFDIGTTIRWLDFSDTTFVGGHPSDNIGAILAATMHANRMKKQQNGAPLLMRDVLDAMIKAYEIQGMLAAENHFDHPTIGLDHVIGVKIASTAVAAKILGADRNGILRALSNAWLDGQALNAYRHTPNSGSRKGWAGGDATSRGVWLAQMAIRGDMGYVSPLSAPIWGFEAVYLDGKSVSLNSPLSSFVLDNVIFKIYPCQRNATTALEGVIKLHSWLKGRIDDIKKITIWTQDEAMRRINKVGPLPNRAARDHSLQYVVAIGLLRETLTIDDYTDDKASDPRIDWLRSRMEVIEDQQYTIEHHDLSIRSCANSIEIELNDGTISPRIETKYPIGDPSRRAEALPLIAEKFNTLTQQLWSSKHRAHLLDLLLDYSRLEQTSINDFMSMVVEN